MHTKFWLESLKGRDHLENLHVDWRIILKRILNVLDVRVDSSGLGYGPMVSPSEHSNEPSVSVQVEKVLDHLSDHLKDSMELVKYCSFILLSVSKVTMTRLNKVEISP
jgi:hypothetical protein